jgi:polyketide synthase 12
MSPTRQAAWDRCAPHRPRTRGKSCRRRQLGQRRWGNKPKTTSRDESQLALRDGVCFAPRLVRPTDEHIGGAQLFEAGAWRLATLGNGTLDSRNLFLRAWPESNRPLERGEVRIGVRCTGVNFRDVLTALGLYPHPGVDVGSEGSGIVLEVAEDMSPPHRVMGMFHGVDPCRR